MNKYLWTALTLTSVLMISANADSLKDKKARKEAIEAVMKDKVDPVNKKCGTEIKIDVDWKSFDNTYEKGHTPRSAASYCGSVFKGIQSICESMGEEGKASVKKSIQTVKCSYAKGVATKDFAKKLELTDGTLHAQYDWGTGNIGEGAKEFLGGKLE